MKISELLGIAKEADPKSIDFLEGALTKQAQSGFDYLKFKQSISQLTGLNLDPAIALKSAFATVSTMGVTKDGLLQSARYYLTLLGNEKQQFDAALQNQVQQRVEAKKVELSKLQGLIEEHKRQIARLEKEIADFEDRIARSDEELNDANQMIGQTKDKFENTYLQFVSAIERDVAFIQQNL
jgi:flagellar motility protein MotE (MotC chaperone)